MLSCIMSSSHRRRVGGLYDAIYTYNIHYTHTHNYIILYSIANNNNDYYMIPARVVGIVFPKHIKWERG